MSTFDDNWVRIRDQWRARHGISPDSIVVRIAMRELAYLQGTVRPHEREVRA